MAKIRPEYTDDNMRKTLREICTEAMKKYWETVDANHVFVIDDKELKYRKPDEQSKTRKPKQVPSLSEASSSSSSSSSSSVVIQQQQAVFQQQQQQAVFQQQQQAIYQQQKQQAPFQQPQATSYFNNNQFSFIRSGLSFEDEDTQ